MDSETFDRLTRRLGTLRSRRGILHLLAALPLTGVVGTLLDEDGEARRGRNRRRRRRRARRRRDRKKTKIKFNAFGCVNVGDFCQSDEQCCSGRCFGRLGASPRCQSHNVLDCPAGADGCAGTWVECGTNDSARCFQTTGKANFCGDGFITCVACTKDVECESLKGPGAACVVCATCAVCPGCGNTACLAAAD